MIMFVLSLLYLVQNAVTHTDDVDDDLILY